MGKPITEEGEKYLVIEVRPEMWDYVKGHGIEGDDYVYVSYETRTAPEESEDVNEFGDNKEWVNAKRNADRWYKRRKEIEEQINGGL